MGDIFIVKLPMIFFALLSNFGSPELNNDKIDTKSPEVVLSCPQLLSDVIPGSQFILRAELKDDCELDSYKIWIEKGGTKDPKYVKAFSVYDHKDAWGHPLPKIKGKRFVNLEFDIGVSSEATIGDYILSLTVKDKAGKKQTIKRYFNLCPY